MGNRGEICGVVSNPSSNRTSSFLPSLFLFSVWAVLCVKCMHLYWEEARLQRDLELFYWSLSLSPEVQKFLGMRYILESHSATSAKLRDYNTGESPVVCAVLHEAGSGSMRAGTFLRTSIWCSPISLESGYVKFTRVHLCSHLSRKWVECIKYYIFSCTISQIPL